MKEFFNLLIFAKIQWELLSLRRRISDSHDSRFNCRIWNV